MDINTPVFKALEAELRSEILRKFHNGTLTTSEELMGYSLGAAVVARKAEVPVAKPVDLPKRRVAAPELLTGRLRQDII